MIHRAFILKSWDEQIHTFKHNLWILRIRPTKKAVHEIRVAIKEIRSFLRLKKAVTGIPVSKEFDIIDLLFKTTGRQRDFEMSTSLLSRYIQRENINAVHFKKILQVDCRITRRWTKEASLNFDENILQIFTREIQAAISPYTEDELIRKIKMLVHKILLKTAKLSVDLKKNVHEIRKLLKDPYYWITSAPGNIMTSESRITAFKKLLNSLGDWQDRFIFLKKISRYKKEFAVKSNSEFVTLKKLEETVKKEQADLFHKIRANLKELLAE
jgi:CHAD domain-containing protein